MPKNFQIRKPIPLRQFWHQKSSSFNDFIQDSFVLSVWLEWLSLEGLEDMDTKREMFHLLMVGHRACFKDIFHIFIWFSQLSSPLNYYKFSSSAAKTGSSKSIDFYFENCNKLQVVLQSLRVTHFDEFSVKIGVCGFF